MGVVAAIAIPNLMSARVSANESAAIATMRSIASAQEQFKAIAVVDMDHDDHGEYGYIGEMSGAVPLRGSKDRLTRPLLAPHFQEVQDGVCIRSGYVFRVDLPGPGGMPLPEGMRGGAGSRVLPDAAEAGWVVYAWPLDLGSTGKRAFVLDESGDLYSTANEGDLQRYTGLDHMPAGDAAYLTSNSNRERGTRSVRRGRDGAIWMKEY